jgi:predicted ferric reductase
MKKNLIYTALVSNLLVILYFWWSYSGQLLSVSIPSALVALGRLSGLMAAFHILLQFMLIGRSAWLEKTFGLDKLARIHHLNGQYSIIYLLLHPTLLITGYAIMTNDNVIEQFLTFFTSYPDVWMATLGLIIFISLICLSIAIVRKRLRYETWYFTHLFMYLAVFLSFWHQLKVGEDFLANNSFVLYWYALYSFVLLSHLYFRFIYPSYLYSKHRFVVDKLVKETEDTTSVYITGKKLGDFHIKPGQFMILRFMSRELWWQAHPFSFSKVPDGNSLRVSIKNVGDFTSRIPFIKPGTPVYLQGPYGIFTEDQLRGNKALLIAGGIGITPIRSLAEHLGQQKKDIIVMYSNKFENEIVFKNELDAFSQQYKFPLHYFLSQEKKTGFQSGRIDAAKIASLVKDIKERDIFICGPVPMMEALRKDLMNNGIAANAIHYEKFAL